MFDPWVGANHAYQKAFSDPDLFYSSIKNFRQQSWNAYSNAGLNLRQIVDNGGNNRLTERQAGEMMGPLSTRATWRPYSKFLEALGLGTGPQHATNYEPRFLEALMVENSDVLKDVKEDWDQADPQLAEIRRLKEYWSGIGTIP